MKEQNDDFNNVNAWSDWKQKTCWHIRLVLMGNAKVHTCYNQKGMECEISSILEDNVIMWNN